VSLDSYALRAGTTSKLLLLFLRSAEEPTEGRTGLAAETAGATAAYVREGDTAARRIGLIDGRPGAYASGSFVEVDPDLAPGVYQFGVPDEALAPGSSRAVLMFRFPGTVAEAIEIDLVGYDPQDSVRLGMSAISPEARIAALRGAFPLLTERELAMSPALEEPD